MDKIKTIIIDDEESARDVLENLLLRFCPEITILAKCENIPKGVELIKELKPDLIFIDIEMPNYAGYEIVDFFEQIPFEIIFVTAYDKYAIRAFEIAAIDYLLKPIDIERLKESVERANATINLKQQAERLNLLSNTLKTNEIKSIIVTEKGNQEIVSLSDIIAFEAQESYCFIHTLTKKYTVSKNLKYFETLLIENPTFIRVHKSWIVSKPYIKNYSKSELNIHLKNDITAKLSKYKKAEFESLILY